MTTIDKFLLLIALVVFLVVGGCIWLLFKIEEINNYCFRNHISEP